MSNPNVKDEAGDRAMLIAGLKEVRGYSLIGRGTRGRRINNLIGQAIAVLSSDANDKRIAELERDCGDAHDLAIKRENEAIRATRRAEAAEAQLRLTGTEEAGNKRITDLEWSVKGFVADVQALAEAAIEMIDLVDARPDVCALADPHSLRLRDALKPFRRA